MLNQDFLNQRLIFWDLETTGLHVEKGDKIIQFAGVEVINGEITGYYEQKIKPLIGYKNGQELLKDVGSSFNVHQISMDMLKDQPTLSQVKDDILNFMKDAIIIAHNGDSFDIPFLDQELENINEPTKLKQIISGKRDTLFLSRCFDAKEKKHNLDAITSRYSSPDLYQKIKVKKWNGDNEITIDLNERQERHDALVDCALLAKLFLNLVKTNAWDFSLLKNFKEKIKPINFSSFELPTDYQPVIASVSEKDSQKNQSYLNELEKELTKAKKKADPNFSGVVMPLMKEELLKTKPEMFKDSQDQNSKMKMRI